MSDHLLLNSSLLKNTQWSILVRCRWLQIARFLQLIISRILFSRKVHVTKRHPSRGRKSQPAVLSDGEGITKECLVAGRILQEMLGASLIFSDFHPFTSEQTSCTKYPDPPDEDLKWPKGKKKATKKTESCVVLSCWCYPGWLREATGNDEGKNDTLRLRQLPSMPKIAAFHVIRLNPLVKRQRAWESHVPKKEGPKEMKVLPRLESCNVSAGRT